MVWDRNSLTEQETKKKITRILIKRTHRALFYSPPGAQLAPK